MNPPDMPASGESVLTWAEKITAAIRAIWPQRSPDILPRISINGTTWRLTRGQSASTAQELRAFDAVGLSVPNDSGPPTISLLVAKGTINDRADGAGLTVTGNIADSAKSCWQFALSPSETKYGEASVTLDSSGATTAAAFSLVSSPTLTGAGDPDTGAPPALAYRKLFKVQTDGDYNITVTQYTDGAQQCTVFTGAWSCTSVTKVVLWTP